MHNARSVTVVLSKLITQQHLLVRRNVKLITLKDENCTTKLLNQIRPTGRIFVIINLEEGGK